MEPLSVDAARAAVHAAARDSHECEISYRQIPPEAAVAIGLATEQSALTKLRINKGQLGDAGVQALAPKLKFSTTLVRPVVGRCLALPMRSCVHALMAEP